MKLERVLKKAAPFLLIAIFIACLFSITQKEGMKAPIKKRVVKDADTDSALAKHTYKHPASLGTTNNILW